MALRIPVQQSPCHIGKDSQVGTQIFIALESRNLSLQALPKSQKSLRPQIKNSSKYLYSFAKDFQAVTDPMDDSNLIKAFMKAFIQYLAQRNNTLKLHQSIKAQAPEPQECFLKAKFFDLYWKKSYLAYFQFLR